MFYYTVENRLLTIVTQSRSILVDFVIFKFSTSSHSLIVTLRMSNPTMPLSLLTV